MDIPYLKSFPSVDDNRQQLAELGLEHNALELNIYGFTVVEPEKTGFGGARSLRLREQWQMTCRCLKAKI